MSKPIINQDILNIIRDLAWESLNDDPEYGKEVDALGVALSAAHEKIDMSDLRTLENAPYTFSERFGAAMFQLGLQIGRDPLGVLTLPQRKTMR